MNAQDLLDEWKDGERPGMRPKRVQALRDDLAEATGLSIPHRVPEIEGWLETMRSAGVITRKLQHAAEVDEGPDDDEAEEGIPPDDAE